MKKFIFSLFCLFFLDFRFVIAADSADEQVMRPALLTRFLSEVKWSDQLLDRISSEKFHLCVYKHYPTYRGFTKYLAAHKLFNRPIEVSLVSSTKEMKACHAVYVRAQNQNTFNDQFDKSGDLNAILFGEGREAARTGMHFGMFIGDDKVFKFELNLDEFERTGQRPSQVLLQLGGVAPGEIVQKANLMRSLIGYTKWPKSSPLNSELVICSEEKDLFSEYSQFLLTQKSLKDRNTQFKYLNDGASTSSSDGCNVVLFSSTNENRFKSLVYNREVNKVLLIGNASGLGEKGVHYNLQLPEGEGKYRFEMNLSALNLTGHEPHFQLLNSALIVREDFPLFSQMLTKAVQLTDWPKDANNSKSVNLCLWQGEKNYKALNFFNSEIKKSYQKLSIKKIQSPSNINQCNALLIADVGQDDLALIHKLREEHGFLLITSQKNASRSGAHYNLKIAPKKITLELFEDNLRNSGFIPHKALREIGVIIGGESQ